MKIIFILPDLGSGGAERVVSILSEEIVNKGYHVDIIMMYGNRVQYQLHPKVGLFRLNLLGQNIWKRLKILRKQLKSIIGNEKAVVVPFQDSVLNMVLVASLGLMVRVVACERNNPYIKGVKLIKKLRAMFPYWLSDYCVFQTPDARNYYSIISDEKCSIIINPITVPKLEWNGKVDAEHLISVCRLHRQKNIPMTLKVIQELKPKYPNIHLSIYGEGDLRDEITKEINEMGLQNNISLCGTTKQVIQKLSESSIFISTSDFEGISNSMLEAMAVGVPMVCTDCPIGGAHLMLSDGAGYLSAVGNVKQFVDKVDNLLSNQNQCQRMSEIAKKKASMYTPECVAKQWIEVFNKLL